MLLRLLLLFTIGCHRDAVQLRVAQNEAAAARLTGDRCGTGPTDWPHCGSATARMAGTSPLGAHTSAGAEYLLSTCQLDSISAHSFAAITPFIGLVITDAVFFHCSVRGLSFCRSETAIIGRLFTEL